MKWLVAAIVVALVAATAAIAASVSVSSQTASASWLGLTQPPVAAAPGLYLPTQNTIGSGFSTLTMTWATVPNATAYRIWVDGKPNSVVPAEAATTEARLLTLTCGASHRWNAQGLNGKSVGPLAAQPVYFDVPTC